MFLIGHGDLDVTLKGEAMSRIKKIANKIVGGYMDGWKAGVARNIEQVFGRGERVDWEYSSYLTFTSGTSNKFHYFAVVKTEDGEYIGGNAYGRIGANAKIIEIARGLSRGSVMSIVQRKEGEKYNKGYNRG